MTTTDEAAALAEAAMAMCESALGGKRCPCRDAGAFNCAEEYPGKQARVALDAIGYSTLTTERDRLLAERRDVAVERERCAAIAENYVNNPHGNAGQAIAQIIREGNHEHD